MEQASDVNTDDDNIPCIKLTTAFLLDTPPSCIAFFPLNSDYFIVGTYHLEAEETLKENKAQSGQDDAIPMKQIRTGSLLLFRLQDDMVSLVETLIRPYAILDVHFSPSEHTVFAVATSTGHVCFFRLDIQNSEFITILDSIQVCDPSILVLSLAWRPSQVSPSTIAVSLSDGSIVVLGHLEGPAWTTRVHKQAHSLEAWVVVWSSHQHPNGTLALYSGGDDSVFCMHSSTQYALDTQATGNDTDGNSFDSSFPDKKTHSAGVTAILPLAIPSLPAEEVIMTGSYDESVRVLGFNRAISPNGRNKTLAEKKLGGGVWRLKLLGTIDSELNGEICLKVLASCMHAGAKVLRVHRSVQGIWTIQVLAKFVEHESMNYASDARPGIPEDGVGEAEYTCVSTSFYDRKLCVWKIAMGIE